MTPVFLLCDEVGSDVHAGQELMHLQGCKRLGRIHDGNLWFWEYTQPSLRKGVNHRIR